MCTNHIRILKQLWLSVAASIGYFIIGLVRGYSSSAVLSMEDTSPHLVPSVDAESWISAVPPLGAFFGSLLAGPLMERFGRKTTLLVSAPISFIGWSLIATASSFSMMVTARFITGFCAGIVTPSAQIYVSECSDPHVRGVLGSLPALFMAGGILVSYIMGAWLPWQPLAWASAAFPIVLLLMLLPLPESPAWLRNRNRSLEADKAAQWLHQLQHVADIPLEARPPSGEQPVFTVEPPPMVKEEEKAGAFSVKELLRRPVIIPLLISLALLAFQQLSGIDAIIFYTTSIFRASGSPIDDHLATILVGLVQLCSNFLALFIVDRAGRRPLLLTSGFLMSLAMATLGTFFYLNEKHQADNIQLLPLISLLIFMFGFSIGYCTLPFLLMGELLPVRQRSLFGSVAGSFNLGVMFVVIKTYPDLKSTIGSAGTFWLYSGMSLLSCFFVFFLVPETKGKSLDEIEEYFEARHMSKEKRAALELTRVIKEGDNLLQNGHDKNDDIGQVPKESNGHANTKILQ